MRQRLARVRLLVVGKRHHPISIATAVTIRRQNVISHDLIASSLVLDWTEKEGPISTLGVAALEP